jgi:hypothetical protein
MVLIRDADMLMRERKQELERLNCELWKYEALPRRLRPSLDWIRRAR